MRGARLRVRIEGATHVCPLAETPITIGRDPGCELALTDPSVSWHHASVWVQEGGVHLRDLGSTNGTFVGGERLRGERRVASGAVVRIGHHVDVEVVGEGGAAAPGFVIDDLRRGLRFQVAVGATDLEPLGVGLDGRIHVGADGTVALETRGVRVAVALGEVVDLDGARLRVVAAERSTTEGVHDEPYPYRLAVRLEGPQGPEAHLEDRTTGHHHTVTSENRVVLLYILARKVADDLADGRPAADAGWCADEDLAVGIWGRGERSSSALPVTVHRLRKELAEAGFDAGFLEKGRRVLRARLVDVVIAPS